MRSTTGSLIAAALVAVATAADAQPAPGRTPDQGRLRHQIYLMEGALARAVNFGAASLNQEIRAVMPDMLVLAGESTARGFHLEGYGVFFDVEVPVLRQSMMWSLRTMLDQDDQGTAEALAALRTFVSSSNGPERAAAEAALRRLEAQVRPFGQARRQAGASGSGGVVTAGTGGAAGAAGDPAAARPRVNPQLLNDPNKAYTDAVVQALIDAMIDYSLPMVSSMQASEYLTVAARDNERRDLLAPPNPYEEVSTVMLRIKGGDLAEYRAGKIDRDEARKRVHVQEF